MEMSALVGYVVTQLGDRYKIKLSRVYSGIFLSALNGPGFSITLLSLPKTDTFSTAALRFLDTPTNALGWASSIPATLWAGSATTDHEMSVSNPQTYNVPAIPCKCSTASSLITHVRVVNIQAFR